jgi:DNA polymerase III delta subunit
MAVFSAWWRGFQKNPKIRPVAFLCGSERVLVEDVVATWKKILDPAPWNYAELSAEEVPERALWEAVFTVPVGLDAVRLVVVRRAELLKTPERLLPLLKTRGQPKLFLVLVSSDLEVPRLPPNDLGKKEAPAWLAALSGKGYIIECRAFTRATAPTAVEWVQTKLPMRPAIAGHMLDRADGDLRIVRDTLAKLSALGIPPTVAAINEMFAERPRDTFVDALLAVNKREALMALERLDPDEYLRTVGLLLSSVKFAQMVRQAMVEHVSDTELNRRAGNRSFLLPDVKPVSRFYDRARVKKILETLADADDLLRRGARVGVMEMVVAQW